MLSGDGLHRFKQARVDKQCRNKKVFDIEKSKHYIAQPMPCWKNGQENIAAHNAVVHSLQVTK